MNAFAKAGWTLPKRAPIYSLIVVALAGSIACSYAAAVQHARPQSDVVEHALAIASLTIFASIGYLSIVAQRWGEPAARPAGADPIPEAHGDRAILGLRAWRTVNCGSRALVLQSWHAQHVVWPYGRELCAETASPGIHAFKSAAALLDYIGAEIDSASTVIGIVALWGTVIEHEDGWTAEKAYPVDLRAAGADVAATVRRLYGCETARAAGGLAAAAHAFEERLRTSATLDG